MCSKQIDTSDPNESHASKSCSYGGHHDKIFALAWSPDGDYLASGGRDNTVHIWHASTGLLHHMRQWQNCVLALAWSPDGQHIAVGDTQGLIYVWPVGSDRDVSVYRGHTRFVRSLDWSPDGR
jgi:WD40 repeat protein